MKLGNFSDSLISDCKTKMARGDLRSFDLDSLVEQARKAYEEENCKEVWLTSEDLGAWGRDIGHVSKIINQNQG